MLPFKEATKIVRSLGVKSVAEYQKLYKQGKLPKGLPYAPNEVYAKDRMNRLIVK